jgi:hypothetical protein
MISTSINQNILEERRKMIIVIKIRGSIMTERLLRRIRIIISFDLEYNND